jgi:hypothetical protein
MDNSYLPSRRLMLSSPAETAIPTRCVLEYLGILAMPTKRRLHQFTHDHFHIHHTLHILHTLRHLKALPSLLSLLLYTSTPYRHRLPKQPTDPSTISPKQALSYQNHKQYTHSQNAGFNQRNVATKPNRPPTQQRPGHTTAKGPTN